MTVVEGQQQQPVLQGVPVIDIGGFLRKVRGDHISLP
jgi:hypothetical protein